MAVNVSATFKKDEKDLNGLEAIRKELIEEPLTRRTVVAVIETKAITTDVYGGGVQTPTIRLVHVEALDGDDAATAREMLDRAFTARTGRTDNQPTLFDADAAMADAEQQGLIEPVNDPTAGPWPGDADYPTEPPTDLSAAPDGPADPPTTRKGRK